MKNLRRTFTVLFAAAFSMQVLAQREDKLINQDWSFRFSHQVNASAARRVDLQRLFAVLFLFLPMRA